MNNRDATHRVVYITQSRIEEFVKVDDTGKIVEAGPMLQIFEGCTLNDVRARKMVTKVEDLRPVVVPKEERLIHLTDEGVE